MTPLPSAPPADIANRELPRRPGGGGGRVAAALDRPAARPGLPAGGDGRPGGDSPPPPPRRGHVTRYGTVSLESIDEIGELLFVLGI